MAQLAYAEMWIVLFILSWMDVLFDVHHAKENGDGGNRGCAVSDKVLASSW